MSKDLKVFQTEIKDVGTFVFKYPTVADTIEIARLRAEKYLYGIRYEWDDEAKKDVALGIDNVSLNLATTFCELIVCTKKAPKDFDYDACDDLDLILELSEEFYKWRSQFRKSKTTSKDPTGVEEATG